MTPGGAIMVHTIVDGTFRQTNLTNEPSDYLRKREELRLAEIELMRQREHVAELRRKLPQGAPVQDYQFEEGPRDLNAGDEPARAVHLSELFTKPNRSLVVYHFMFGKRHASFAVPHPTWSAAPEADREPRGERRDAALSPGDDPAAPSARARRPGAGPGP